VKVDPETTCIICLQREWTVLYRRWLHGTVLTARGLVTLTELDATLKICRPCCDQVEARA